MTSSAQFWEDRYAQRSRVWSGRPNAALAELASALVPGRALDLGCGEGGDAVWLAQRDWRVTAVDISSTAIERGRAAAAALPGVGERIEWIAADLAEWQPAGAFDLVTACFLQSPVELDRTRILRGAASAVVPGGSLLVVAHAAPPPWIGHDHPFGTVPDPAREVAELGLDASGWELRIAEVRQRDGVGPDGKTGVLSDSVVLAVRRVAQ